MLSFFFLKIRNINFLKTGLYLDYCLRVLSKIFTYNLFIYTAYFFAEKYLIEFNTRYVFNYTVTLFNQTTLKFSQNRSYVYLILFLINILVVIC